MEVAVGEDGIDWSVAEMEDDFWNRRAGPVAWARLGVKDIGDDEGPSSALSAVCVVGRKSRGIEEEGCVACPVGPMDDVRLECPVGVKSVGRSGVSREWEELADGTAPPCFDDGTKSGGMSAGLPVFPFLSTAFLKRPAFVLHAERGCDRAAHASLPLEWYTWLYQGTDL